MTGDDPALAWGLVAVALAGASAYLAVPPAAARRLHALAAAPRTSRSGRDTQRQARVAAVVGACLLGGAYAGAVGAVAVIAVAAFSWHRRRRGRAQALAAEAGDAVVVLCGALVAELRAGREPASALASAAEGVPDGLLPRARAAAASGGDVASALRADGGRLGAGGLVRLAACWEVAAHLGSGLVAPVSRMAAGLADEAAVQRELELQRASPRATAQLLAVLPLFAVALGTAMGADPVHVLTRTPVGWCCLIFGGVLSAAGVVWTDRLCDGVAERAGVGRAGVGRAAVGRSERTRRRSGRGARPAAPGVVPRDTW